MTTPLIPAFDIHGVVPPIRPDHDGASGDRTPYRADLLSFCQRFGASPERRSILCGLLDLRSELTLAGKSEGFQWINGSFTEEVEVQQSRTPNDVDVVTFIAFGDTAAQRELCQTFPDLVDPAGSKQRFRVDHYLVSTDEPLTIDHAQRLAYWCLPSGRTDAATTAGRASWRFLWLPTTWQPGSGLIKMKWHYPVGEAPHEPARPSVPAIRGGQPGSPAGPAS